MAGPYSSPKAASTSRSFLNLMTGKGTLSDDKLEKRRATNRRSQQKARENKESLIRKLEEENARLRDSLQTNQTQTTHAPPSYSSSPPSLTYSHSHSHAQSPLTPDQPAGYASIDLEACREGFMAVLASVCDPHLNTIHAVCQKFSQSRGNALPGPSLNPPRPVDRPLNIWMHFTGSSSTNAPSAGSATGYGSGSSSGRPSVHYPSPGFDLGTMEGMDGLGPLGALDFVNLTPPSNFIPPPELAGPLSVPYLEPAHPAFDLEMDATEIWKTVLGIVDMSRTDAESLASRITGRVRCYGFGPVVLKQDVVEVCGGFPQLTVDFS